MPVPSLAARVALALAEVTQPAVCTPCLVREPAGWAVAAVPHWWQTAPGPVLRALLAEAS